MERNSFPILSRRIRAVYEELFGELNKAGVEWVQIDEPYLVTDLSAEDVALFVSLYTDILKSKGKVKVLLQTYFGDVRDCYEELTGLPFDGLGLDFLEGKQTLALLEKYGFPADKILFAGVVNGKNIWKCDYKKTLELLFDDQEYRKAGCDRNFLLSAPCSVHPGK